LELLIINYQDTQWIFSGIGTAVITIVFSLILAIKFGFNPFRFFISQEETLFMSSSSRTFRKIYLSLIVILGSSIYFSFLTNFNLKDSNKFAPIKYLLPVLLSPITIYSSIILLLIFFVLAFSKIVRTKMFNFINTKEKESSKRLLSLILIFSIIYYLFICSLYNGIIINTSLEQLDKNLLLNNDNSLLVLLDFPKINKEYYFDILFPLFLYALVFYPAKRVFTFIMTSKTLVNVTLMNGIVYEHKFLLNPNIDDCLLICDSENMYDPNKTMIPRSNIQEIKFKTFNTSLGGEIKTITPSKIRLPENFDQTDVIILVNKSI
jgi:hypothetical protein